MPAKVPLILLSAMTTLAAGHKTGVLKLSSWTTLPTGPSEYRAVSWQFMLQSRLLVAMLGATAIAGPVDLKPETIEAFDQYVTAVESRIQASYHNGVRLPDGPQLRNGSVIVEPGHGSGLLVLKGGGLIEDWIGAVFIPDAKLANVLAVAQDYAHHKDYYKPEVADTLVRRHQGNDFSVYMRIVKTKLFLTDVLNTEHEIHFVPIDAKRWYSIARGTRVAEVTDAGKAGERELPVGKDRGLLWRINGYWYFEEKEGGVYVQCESITMTRDVPFGMGKVFEPFIHGLPAESLRAGLQKTRNAVLARAVRSE